MAQAITVRPQIGGFTRLLAAAGFLAPLIYAGTVIYGGLLDPTYDHVAEPVSALIETGAPFRDTLDPLFLLYNALALVFAAGLFRHFARQRPSLALGSVVMAVTAVFGLVMKYFPMDPIGTEATFAGAIHIVLAGLMSLGAMATLVLFAVGLRQLPDWQGWSRYTWVALVLTAATGAVAALAAVQLWPTLGLWERLTIAAHLQWMLAFGARLAFRD